MIRSAMEISWYDLQKMNKEKTVLFVGIAPIEEHGRHLPLGVDIYETEFWMEQAIEQLDKETRDYEFISLPIIPYGHAVMKGFPGNIHLSQKMLYALLLATLRNIVEWGIKNIIIISGHADPRHTIAIEQACEKIKEESNIIPFAPMGAIFSNKVNLDNKNKATTKADKIMTLFSNDFHAGWIETSNMLQIKPELVRNNYLNQPDIIINARDMIDAKLVAYATKGYGHLGFPKEASKELGKELNEEVILKIKKCIMSYLLRKDYQLYEHHSLYNIPSLRIAEEDLNV